MKESNSASFNFIVVLYAIPCRNDTYEEGNSEKVRRENGPLAVFELRNSTYAGRETNVIA